MNDNNLNNIEITPSDWVKSDAAIKVIGVGGGGCNAVSYMYDEGIKDCTFIVCNTDSQALNESPVPLKIQLGKGLGAGTDPVKGRNAALESQDTISKVILGEDTQMLFITAGLGGGTGTGAAPVIAKMSKDKGILTVGVVTIPFENEGNEALAKATDGIRELEKNVDSLLIINNEKLYEYYGNLLLQDAFPKTNEVLSTAVRAIIEIIKKPGYINVDFQDVLTMMRNSGMALLGCGTGSGENRLKDAVDGAFTSPLLNDFDLTTAKNLLVNITVSNNEKGLKMEELREIDKMIEEYTGNVNKFKKGIIWNEAPDADDKVNITVVATGFEINKLSTLTKADIGNIIVISKDFIYRPEENDEITIPDEYSPHKIGYNTSENSRNFHFSENNKPALILEHGENTSQLENIPAIRRIGKSSGEV